MTDFVSAPLAIALEDNAGAIFLRSMDMRAELKIPALTELVLSRGSHSDRADGVCLMEAVAWFAGEEHSDAPACCSPVLAAFFRSWNDGMRTDDERAQLKQYVPLLVGTAAPPSVEQKRGWMALDWLMRVQSVEWLHQAGLDHHATALAALPEINNGPIDDESRKRIQAAGAAARAATGDAAEAAAEAAAGAAAKTQLEPSVEVLQASAHNLARNMIDA